MRSLSLAFCVLLIGACGSAPSPAGGAPAPTGSASAAASATGAPIVTASPPAIAQVPLITPPVSLPAGASVVAKFRVVDPGGPAWLAGGFGSLWVGNGTAIIRLDPATGAVQGSVSTPSVGDSWAVSAFGALWESDFGRDVVYRIDPKTMRLVDTIHVGLAPEGVAVTTNTVWVADHHAGDLSGIDPATNQVAATVHVGPSGDSGPYFTAATSRYVWVTVPNNDTVVGVDAATNAVVARLLVDGMPASDGTEVWLAVWDGMRASSLERLDPATGETLSRTALDDKRPNAIAIGLGSVWVWTGNGLYRIDQATGNVLGLASVGCQGGGCYGGLTVADRSVWLSIVGQPNLLKIQPRE